MESDLDLIPWEWREIISPLPSMLLHFSELLREFWLGICKFAADQLVVATEFVRLVKDITTETRGLVTPPGCSTLLGGLRHLRSLLKPQRIVSATALDHHLGGSGIKFSIHCCCFAVVVWGGIYVANRVYHYLDGAGWVRGLLCRYLTSRLQDTPPLTDDSRSNFSDITCVETNLVANHTHPISAALRSSASIFISRYASTLGMDPYYVQRSKSDERAGRKGSRIHYWVKDLTARYSCFKTNPDTLLALVDVDYYLDMEKFLTDNFLPVVLYTFQPEQVARTKTDGVGEYSYTFNRDNEVCFKVNGGGSYTHKVWNYGLDQLMVSRTSFFPMSIVTSCYLVDRRYTSTDRQLILLSPIAKWTGVDALVARNLFAGQELRRLNVNSGGFLRLEICGKVHAISTGKAGEYNQCTVPVEIDNAMRSVSLTSKNTVGLWQIKSYLKDFSATNDGLPIILLEYHRSKEPCKPDIVFPSEYSIRRYQLKPKLFDPDAKTSLVAFMSPIVEGCYSPDLSLGNEKACIEHRINVKDLYVEMTKFLDTCIEEFAERLVPLKHILDPYDYDDVYDKQCTPAQRRKLDEVAEMEEEPPNIINMFQKKEASQAAKPARAISTINGYAKLEYSRFTYAFTNEILKKQKWYAFGKSPLEVALRVTEIAQDADTMLNGDLEVMDGHVNWLSREISKRCKLRAFKPVHHALLLKCMRSQKNMKAYGAQGSTYEQGEKVASGGPATSEEATTITTFISFLAYRKTMVGGYFLNADQAWDLLGMYGGDDSVNRNLSVVKLSAAARMLGQVLTGCIVNKGEMGVKFLSRQYGPEVWLGNPNSCCDISRQLTKFHTTVHLNSDVTPEMKLIEKCRAYYLTDRNTPIIGAFVSRVMELNGGRLLYDERTSRMRAWNSDLQLEVQYPNEHCDFMDEYVSVQLEGFEFQRFANWLRQLSDVFSALSPPLCIQPKPPKAKYSAVINGELSVGDKPDPNKVNSSKSNNNKKKKGKPNESKKSESRPPLKNKRKKGQSPTTNLKNGIVGSPEPPKASLNGISSGHDDWPILHPGARPIKLYPSEQDVAEKSVTSFQPKKKTTFGRKKKWSISGQEAGPSRKTSEPDDARL